MRPGQGRGAGTSGGAPHGPAPQKPLCIAESGAPHNNMLAETFEALMGAVYLDGGLDAVTALLTDKFPIKPVGPRNQPPEHAHS